MLSKKDILELRIKNFLIIKRKKKMFYLGVELVCCVDILNYVIRIYFFNIF